MLGRGQPGRSRRGQCPGHGGARTPRLTHGRPSGRGTRRGKRQNRCSARAARGPALPRRSRRRRPPPRRSSRPRQRPGGGRKSRARGSCLIGLALVFSATPPDAGRVAPLQPPPPSPLRFSGCGTGWKEQMGRLSMRLARPAPPPPLPRVAARTEHAQPAPGSAPLPINQQNARLSGRPVRPRLRAAAADTAGRGQERKGGERLFPPDTRGSAERTHIYSNAAYVTHVLLRTCLAHLLSPCSNPERWVLQLVNPEIMEGCSKLRHPRGLDRVEGQFKVSKPVLYLYKDILT